MTCICGHENNDHEDDGCHAIIHDKCSLCHHKLDTGAQCSCKKYQDNWIGTREEQFMNETGLWHRPYGHG